MASTNIFFFISRADVIGGAQVHVITLSKLARDNGYLPTICGGHQSGDLVSWCFEENIRYQHIPGLSNDSGFISTLKSLFQISSIFSSSSSIYSFHSSKAGAIGRISSTLSRTRILYTVHGWNYTNQLFTLKGFLYFLIEFILEIFFSFYCDLVFVSNFDKLRRPLPFFNRFPSNFLIYNTVSNIVAKPSSTTQSPGLHIGMIGRFSNQKAHLALLNAVRFLPSVSIDFVGDGYTLSECKEFASFYDIANRVHFLGRLSNHDARSCLFRWDIYLLVSNYEGFPRSILEALASGTPIIASNVGGCSEFFSYSDLSDRSIGILLPNNQPESIASSISYYLDNPDLISVHGENARFIYDKYFSFSAFSNAYLTLWSNLG